MQFLKTQCPHHIYLSVSPSEARLTWYPSKYSPFCYNQIIVHEFTRNIIVTGISNTQIQALTEDTQ